MFYINMFKETEDSLAAFLTAAPTVDDAPTTTKAVEDCVSASEDIKRTVKDNLERFYNKYIRYYNLTNKHDMYYTFQIPKASGGLRTITAPNDGVDIMFTELRDLLQGGFVGIKDLPLYHDNAFAYMPKRWVKLAAQRHQKNASEYFAKFDIHDFFGSTTQEFAMRMIYSVYPFCMYAKDPELKELMTKVLAICFLDNGLPQGTQISPLLTNIIMLPFDYIFSDRLRGDYIYTRYADDIIISNKNSFDWHDIYFMILGVMDKLNAPYEMNDRKVKYLRNKGNSNWILGVQLNDRNDLTIGRRRKREIRYMLHNFFKFPENYTLGELQTVAGKIVWFQNVEPEVYKETIKYYNRKYGCDVMKKLYRTISERSKL